MRLQHGRRGWSGRYRSCRQARRRGRGRCWLWRAMRDGREEEEGDDENERDVDEREDRETKPFEIVPGRRRKRSSDLGFWVFLLIWPSPQWRFPLPFRFPLLLLYDSYGTLDLSQDRTAHRGPYGVWWGRSSLDRFPIYNIIILSGAHRCVEKKHDTFFFFYL